jgi:hypothetical protein
MPAPPSTRFTTRPDTPGPQLLCPTCDLPLVYRQTIVAGVEPVERWDYYECRTCGPFEYRHRTRKLKRTDQASTHEVTTRVRSA